MSKLLRTSLLMTALVLPGCTEQFIAKCARMGAMPNSPEMVACVTMQEQMMVNSINQASAILGAAAIAATPQTYYIHTYRH